MQNIDSKTLEEMVKKVLMETLGQNEVKEENGKHVDPSGVISVQLDKVKLERFDTGNEKDKVYYKEALSLEESPRIGSGILELNDGSAFDWTLTYDELDYVMEGTLEITIDGRKVVGNKGDLVLIPKGSSVTFATPNYAKCLWIVYPANWYEQA